MRSTASARAADDRVDVREPSSPHASPDRGDRDWQPGTSRPAPPTGSPSAATRPASSPRHASWQRALTLYTELDLRSIDPQDIAVSLYGAKTVAQGVSWCSAARARRIG